MGSPLGRIAIIIDRINELIGHTNNAMALVINKMIVLPTQITMAPVLSLPLILANIVKGDKVHIIPTPFTEAIVFEITEIIKYLRPGYKPA